VTNTKRNENNKAVPCYSMRNAYAVLVGNSEGKIRRRWESNIKGDLKEVGCEKLGCIQV